uniref:Uncharacterized protein n=1 Tax=Timema poppense TaxID=170557 RepID=A0A7R9DWA3_TIMPO|nr:unnamed protein product [Timema poppensis]
MPLCAELFVDLCWWRNSFFNCCDMFELQMTEYGFCYSFNSEVSETRRRSGGRRADLLSGGSGNERRPRRTTKHGEWGGLRLTANTFPDEIPPGANIAPGIIVSCEPVGMRGGASPMYEPSLYLRALQATISTT